MMKQFSEKNVFDHVCGNMFFACLLYCVSSSACMCKIFTALGMTHIVFLYLSHFISVHFNKHTHTPGVAHSIGKSAVYLQIETQEKSSHVNVSSDQTFPGFPLLNEIL